MTNKTLLPPGCYDILPPRARLETHLTGKLMQTFEAYGYGQVAPPMLEYTDSLLAGRGAGLSPQILRVMDPGSQRVMGFRADMTLQVARIASHRLSDAPRPLRLSYSGTILRMQPEALQTERQLRQAGIELIGRHDASADAEVILVAAKALRNAGLSQLTIDFNMPPLIGAILASSSLDNDELQEVFNALAHKDSTSLSRFDIPECQLLVQLLHTAGNAEDALQGLKSLPLPDAAKSLLADLEQVITLLTPQLSGDVVLTVDVTERIGFDYYSGLGFAFFAPKARVELGRGGRYLIGSGGKSETAVGCTFYTDSLRGVAELPPEPARVYISEGVRAKGVDALIADGYNAIFATPEADAKAEASRLDCTHIYTNGKLNKL